jgi:type I restriction enzyme S subunit
MNDSITNINGWTETTLGEVAANISRSFDFSTKENVVFVNTGDVLEGKFLHSKQSSKVGLPGQAKKAIAKGDILFSEIRPINKRYAIVDFDVENYVVSTKFMVIKKNDKIDLNFLYLFLTFEKTLQEFQIIAESRSGTFPQITFKAVLDVPILLPTLPEQKRIASVLSSFDNKIELLQNQNQTLEEMAQVLFKEWFVDYHFPGVGKMIDSELGMIPEGWKIDNIGKYVNLKGGATPSTKNPDYWDGNIHWTSPKDLSISKQSYLLNTQKMITEAGLKKISSGLMPKGTLLFSSRAPIGYIALSNVDIAINQGYIAFLPRAEFSNYFMYNWLKLNMKSIIGAANGSTFLEISKSAFRQLQTPIPDQNTLKSFDELITPVFKKLLNNIVHIQTLSELRDKLLPKLMSGEVRVKLNNYHG